MRKPEFVSAVTDYIEWRTRQSKQTRWRYPYSLALGGYSMNGVDIHFAGVTFLRRTERGVPIHPAEVPPRLGVVSCVDDDQPKNWLVRETMRRADITYDPTTDTVTAQKVVVRSTATTGETTTADAVIPYGSTELPGRIGESVLQITDVINLLPPGATIGPAKEA